MSKSLGVLTGRADNRRMAEEMELDVDKVISQLLGGMLLYFLLVPFPFTF